MAASGVFIDSTRRKGLIKSLTKLLTVVVDPAISGGLLSGGLHAITGKLHLFPYFSLFNDMFISLQVQIILQHLLHRASGSQVSLGCG